MQKRMEQTSSELRNIYTATVIDYNSCNCTTDSIRQIFIDHFIDPLQPLQPLQPAETMNNENGGLEKWRSTHFCLTMSHIEGFCTLK